MNYLFFVLVVLLGYSFFSNGLIILRYKDNKKYMACYKMLGEDKAYETIKGYILETKSDCYKNKARVLLLIEELNKGLDYTQTLQDIDLKSLFYKKNGNFNSKDAEINSDTFLWIAVAMAKAKQKDEISLIDSLYDKLTIYPELESYLELSLLKAVKNALNGDKKEAISFFNKILNGDYIQYNYDKKLIGLYKRFAEATLAYLDEPIDDFYKEDVNLFQKTLIGHIYLSSLNIIDKYSYLNEDPINSEE